MTRKSNLYETMSFVFERVDDVCNRDTTIHLLQHMPASGFSDLTPLEHGPGSQLTSHRSRVAWGKVGLGNSFGRCIQSSRGGLAYPHRRDTGAI
jgi:hypothetical protein